MELLENIYKKIMLTESVDVNQVTDAIDSHKRVIINYHTRGEDNNTGARVIEVYAYGLTKAGNPVIRAFQPYGDTTSRVPSWKFFRLDRISEWQPTEQVFNRPADFYYKNLGEFNPNGDETMSIVYKIAQFGNSDKLNGIKPSEPKTNQDVYKTSSETNMEHLKQQVSNPIKLSDIKVDDAFKQIGKKQQTPTSQPKTQQDVYKSQSEVQKEKNPTQKTPEEKQKDLEKLRKTLSSKPITLSDLNKKMKEEVPEEEPKWKSVFDTQAEKDMEQMRKNDLINMRRRDNRWQKSADSRPLNRKGSLNREF